MSVCKCHNEMNLWRIVSGFIAENKLAFALYVATILAVPLQDVLLPHLAGMLYKRIRSNRPGYQRQSWFILCSILGIVLLIQALDVMDDIIDYHLLPTMQQFVSDLMLSQKFRVHTEEYMETDIGETVVKMHKLPEAVYSYVEIWKNEIVPRSVTIIACCAYILWEAPLLGLFMIGVIAIVAYVAIMRFRKCCIISDAIDAQHSGIIRTVDDVLYNMRTVIGFQKENDEIVNLDEQQKEYARITRETLDCTIVVKYISIPLLLLLLGAVSLVCFNKNSGLAEHVKITLLIVGFIVSKSLFDLFNAYNEIVMKIGVINNTMSMFEECPKDATYRPTPMIDVDPKVCIRVQDVSFGYPGVRPVFERLNLSFERGKATAVVGQTGSGKSTLISLLMGLQRPDSGRIYLNGTPYDDIGVSELRKRIFLLPQSPSLLNRSVFDNIVYGIDTFRSEEVTREEVAELVASMGLGDFIEKVGGFDAPVGVRGSHLSGGQRQIVWLIKLFLADPEVVVIDEPTASLDPETKSTIARLVVGSMKMSSMNKGARTIILSTHDQVLADEADVILNLDDR